MVPILWSVMVSYSWVNRFVFSISLGDILSHNNETGAYRGYNRTKEELGSVCAGSWLWVAGHETKAKKPDEEHMCRK